jgi:hypothetical protein
MALTLLTWFHVLISLIGIGTGFVVLADLLANQIRRQWTLWFLVTTAVTSLTGFVFPFNGFTPALGVGIIATLIMAATLAALYIYGLRGRWRVAYVVGAVLSLYLNVFVLVVQAFLKVPPLHALAPNGTEPPFAITQVIVLVLFLAAGVLSLRRFTTAAP